MQAARCVAASVCVAAVVLVVGVSGTAPRPSEAEVRLAERMRDWIRQRGREPNQEELRQNAEMRQAWDAYQRVRAYANQEADRAAERQRQARVAAANTAYQQAATALDQKQYPGAIRVFRELLANTDAAALHERCKTRLEEIDRAGMSELDQARQLFAAKRYREARQAYLAVINRFAGVEASVEARKALEVLDRDPVVIKALREEHAALILAGGNAAYAAKEYYRAHSAYVNVTTNYADTPAVTEASQRLAAMRADPALMAEVERQRVAIDIANMVAQANAFEKAGLIDRAINKLQELVSVYPDAPEAKDAKARIEELWKTR